MNNTILVVDGTNLMHRNHFAYPEKLTDFQGNRTGAILGTIKQIKRYSEQLNNVRQIFVCNDVHRRTFRNDIYAEYKGTRGKTDPSLKQQIPLLKEFCRCCNIPYIELDNYEADDLIGSLSKNAVNYGFKPLVVSGDRDVFQLIDEDIDVMYVSTKGLIKYGPEELKEKYCGLTPEQFLDLKALMGDSGDNIPGVYGVGEKTGIKLLLEHFTLDGIYANIDKLKGKLKESLINNKDMAYLSKQLATIKTDLELDYISYFETLVYEKYDFFTDEAVKFYEKLNIKKLN